MKTDILTISSDGSNMEEGFQSVWEKGIRPLFLLSGVYDENHMLYYYEYIKAGKESLTVRPAG